MITLTIKGEDLNYGGQKTIRLVGSNIFTILPKYLAAIKDIYVEDYTLTTPFAIGGNTGLNAGAYLNQYMGELTGMDLRY